MHLSLPPRPTPGNMAGVRARQPWLAGLLSFLVPGLGQVYNGRTRRGLVLLGLAAAWQVLGIGAAEAFRWWAVSLAGYFLLCCAAGLDALRAAKTLQYFRPGPQNSPILYTGCAVALATVSLLAGLAEGTFFPVYTVSQTSMRPTLRTGDRLRSQALGQRDIIRRGQLVVFEYPSEHSLIFVKRVVGLPGEVVEVEDGLVYINGDPIDEGYYAVRNRASKSLDMPAARLAPDEYYVLGDNRYASFDSRSYGPVNRARMLATPLYIVYSVSDDGEWRSDRIGLPAR
ncbi:MAG: signal peptidase I [Desulfovibrionales bacterium GWA2_65_9]|nr:MAG: signal peptidase I [Desulfovibrionales bacterium GWA2_65_9]